MLYEENLNYLANHKLKDPRFSFPSYIVHAKDHKKDGVLDPRYHRIKETKGKNTQSDYYYKGIPIGKMRDAMICENKTVAKGMIEESMLQIRFSDHTVQAVMYRPFHNMEVLPCIIYFHGGAYAGGSITVTANLCRSLSDAKQAVVINVDYRLAPEHPYPQGSDDCYGCFNWICDHAEQYVINDQEIYIAGDSAGGNFAINCCIREHELQLHRIKGCILYYPHVSMAETKEYPWSLDMYYIADEDRSEIVANMLALREVIRASEFFYLQSVIEKEEPIVSPLFYDRLGKLPPTILFSAEFDYLRIQQEYFAQKMNDMHGSLKLIQYQGMQHAFMDHIGYYPQGEDAVYETCAFIEELNHKESDILSEKR